MLDVVVFGRRAGKSASESREWGQACPVGRKRSYWGVSVAKPRGLRMWVKTNQIILLCDLCVSVAKNEGGCQGLLCVL